MLLGIVLIFIATLVAAMGYTLCERIFTLYDKPVDAIELCAMWGCVA
eukprot:SAG11_NODE_225_length_12064_cov_7.850815_1_plen_47_part_00